MITVVRFSFFGIWTDTILVLVVQVCSTATVKPGSSCWKGKSSYSCRIIGLLIYNTSGCVYLEKNLKFSVEIIENTTVGSRCKTGFASLSCTEFTNLTSFAKKYLLDNVLQNV